MFGVGYMQVVCGIEGWRGFVLLGVVFCWVLEKVFGELLGVGVVVIVIVVRVFVVIVVIIIIFIFFVKEFRNFSFVGGIFWFFKFLFYLLFVQGLNQVKKGKGIYWIICYFIRVNTMGVMSLVMFLYRSMQFLLLEFLGI